MKKTSLKAKEALASAVEKHSCLYNNKEKDRLQNPWVETENTLELERGKTYFAYDVVYPTTLENYRKRRSLIYLQSYNLLNPIITFSY